MHRAVRPAGHPQQEDRRAGVVAEQGGIIVSPDGLQPEQGTEQVWVVREVLPGTVLGATNFQQATALARSGAPGGAPR